MKRRIVETSRRRTKWQAAPLHVGSVWALLMVILQVGGCNEQRGPQPPGIYFGQHECDVCRMIISDERYAAAIVIEADDGGYQSLRFDDIGCLFQYEQNEASVNVVARYVRDAENAKWLDAAVATYLHSMNLTTPMAFHVAALGSRESAQAMQAENAGDILDLNDVRERFRAGTLRDF